MISRLQRLVALGITGTQLDAAIRRNLRDLAIDAEEEVGYLLPQAKDRRVNARSDN